MIYSTGPLGNLRIIKDHCIEIVIITIIITIIKIIILIIMMMAGIIQVKQDRRSRANHDPWEPVRRESTETPGKKPS